MDKEKRKILNTMLKFFEEKGYKKEEIEEIEELAEEKEKKKKGKLHPFEKITDLKDMLEKTEKKFGDKPAFKYKTKEPGVFDVITYKEFIEKVNALGTKLIDLGLKGKRIAIISENRYEWCLAYLATCCGTGVVVPLDKSLPANELESLIIRSGVEAIFYSSKYDEVMQDIKQRRTTDLRYYISMDLMERQDGVLSEREFIEKGNTLVYKKIDWFLMLDSS